MSTDRPPTDETTARSTPPPPVPPRSNVLFTRGRDDELEFTPDGFIPRDRQFVKVYFDMAADLVKLVGTGPFTTLILSCRHAVERDGVLVIPRTAKQIAAELGINRDTAITHLGILRQHGFVDYEQGSGTRGHFGSGRWIIKPASGLDRFGINVAPQSGNPTPAALDRSGEIPTAVEKACISPQMEIPTAVERAGASLSGFTGDGEPRLRSLETESPSSERESLAPGPDIADPGRVRLQTEEVVVVKTGLDNNRDSLHPMAELVITQLSSYGVYEARIKQVLEDPGPDECMRQLIALPYRNEWKRGEVRNRAAYVMKAIKEKWDDPEEIKEQRAAEEADRVRRQEELRDRAEEEQRLARELQLDQALAALPAEEREALIAELDAELLAEDAPYRQLFERNPHLLEGTRRQRLRERLFEPGQVAGEAA